MKALWKYVLFVAPIFASAGTLSTVELSGAELTADLKQEHKISVKTGGSFDGFYADKNEDCLTKYDYVREMMVSVQLMGRDGFNVVRLGLVSDNKVKVTTDLESDGSYVKTYELPRGNLVRTHRMAPRYESWEIQFPSTNGSFVKTTCGVSRAKKSITAIAGDMSSACALVDGGVRCFGSLVMQPPTDLKNPHQLVNSFNHYCTLTDDGVRCWTLSDLTSDKEAIDVPSDAIVNPKIITTGSGHGCAIDDEGIICWGSNAGGQATVPGGIRNPTALASGWYHSCTITSSGVKCWGDNFYQQLGSPSMGHPKEIAGGRYRTCAIEDAGITCWGGVQGSVFATTYPGYRNPRKLAVSGYDFCAITDDGVKCQRSTVATDLKNPTEIMTSDDFSCAVTDTGIRCWGDKVPFIAPDLRDWE